MLHKPYNMNAYYYSFEPTGVEEIDLILSAVACAGKSFHHTDDWHETAEWSHLEGKTPVEWIQNAANRAAKARAELISKIEEMNK